MKQVRGTIKGGTKQPTNTVRSSQEIFVAQYNTFLYHLHNCIFGDCFLVKNASSMKRRKLQEFFEKNVLLTIPGVLMVFTYI